MTTASVARTLSAITDALTRPHPKKENAMTAKHTPGPWVASKSTTKASNFADHVAHVSAGPKVIARVNGGVTEERTIALANAALLAAAPDLLAALETLVRRCEASDLQHADGFPIKEARTAIAKARGE